jgi:hypothetical protein
MKMLKTLAILSASTMAIGAAAATPSMAQPWRAPAIIYERPLTTSHVDSLRWRIDNAARMGEISWSQARNLHMQLRRVQPIAYRVQTGVATRGEYNRLARTVDRIERMTATSYASRRAPPYAYGYGWRR